MNFDKPFWRTVLRETDGTASSSRLLSTALVLAVLCWVSYITVHNRHLPDLSPVGMFLASSTTALYGVNKLSTGLSTVLSKITGKDQG